MNLMFPIIVQSTNSYVMNDGWELYNDDLLVLETELVAEIRAYYAHRKLEIPNFHEAMAFAHTEMSEVFEIYLAKKQWVRNNPQNKPTFSKDKLAEELGDAIMMLIVVGIVEDVDPIKALKNKIERKIKNGKT